MDTQVLLLIGKTAFRVCYLTGILFWSIVILSGLHLVGTKILKK